MVLGINILLILLTILPPLIYILIIYFTTPKGSISLKTGFLYFLFGILSTSFLKLFSSYVPDWYNINVGDYILWSFLLHFTRVALIEEGLKYLSFRAISLFRNKRDDSVLSIMFNCAMVGLGFGFFENIIYVNMYGEIVLYTRIFTATILHMITGLIMGYWIALIKIKPPIKMRSVFEWYMNKYPRLRSAIYTLIGIISAITIHGLHNFNIQINGPKSYPLMILIILFGLFVSKTFAEDLIGKSPRRRVSKGNTNSL